MQLLEDCITQNLNEKCSLSLADPEFFYLLFTVCLNMGVYCSAHVEVSGQLWGVFFLPTRVLGIKHRLSG